MSNTNKKQNTPQGLKEQRARRQRINRIKMGIILFLVLWMVACMACNVFLMIRVSSLQNQIGILAEKMLESTQVKVETNAPAPETDGDYMTYEGQEEIPDEAGAKDETVPNKDVRDCIALEDNLRKEDDPMTVYLTFDDGPSENTSEILEILKKHGVKATFCYRKRRR